FPYPTLFRSIVRVLFRSINRGIYDIAVLFDPAKPWSALAPQAQWNGKVVYTFGASTGQPRLQCRSEQNWADDAALSRGFMVVDNSLTDSLYNSNRVLVAETLMVMKEHIVDTYGEIKYTVGNGCSGGSIQQNTAASIFPGLLDGIQPPCDYRDSITAGLELSNCRLPAAPLHDRGTTRSGTRCGDPEPATAVGGTTAGTAPGSTRALQTGDNVGIQYGLNALLAAAITPEEFVTLNEKIGGFDADSNRGAARTTADLPALAIAYRAGIVSSGRNLGKLPIIDSRGYDE